MVSWLTELAARLGGSVRTGRDPQNSKRGDIVPTSTYPFVVDAALFSGEKERFPDTIDGVLRVTQDSENSILAPDRVMIPPLFDRSYVLDTCPPPSNRSNLKLHEQALVERIDEAAVYAKMPDTRGIWNFLATVYEAAAEGRRLNPPVNVWTRFRPEIVWALRQQVIGGGLEMVTKDIRYAPGRWEVQAATQLVCVDRVAQIFGIDITETARKDLVKVFLSLRDKVRRSAELARSLEDPARADELEANYINLTRAYRIPIPLHVPRHGHGNVAWR